MKLKRAMALLLALIMLCSVLAACGNGAADSKNPPAGSNTGSEGGTAAPEANNQEAEKPFEEYTLEDWQQYAGSLEKEGKDKYKVLYIASWAASEYFVNSCAVWQKAFEPLGWELTMLGPTQYTPDSQMSVLESALVSREYDAIIVYPIDSNVFAAAKDDLWETYHTPVIMWCVPESTNSGQYYVMDSVRYDDVGREIGEMAIEYVDQNWDSYFKKYEDTGIPTFIAQSIANANENQRMVAAMDVLEADGRFNIVQNNENVSEGTALQFAESVILNHPEVEIGIIYNDMIAVNYDNALKSTTAELSDHLRLFSADGILSALKMMVEEGENCRIGGTMAADHQFIAGILQSMIRVAVPAAKEGLVVDGLTDYAVDQYHSRTDMVKTNYKNAADFIIE